MKGAIKLMFEPKTQGIFGQISDTESTVVHWLLN